MRKTCRYCGSRAAVLNIVDTCPDRVACIDRIRESLRTERKVARIAVGYIKILGVTREDCLPDTVDSAMREIARARREGRKK